MAEIPPDFGESWRLNEAHCSGCGKMVDGASKAMGDEEGGPGPGDITVCVYCYAVNQYVAGEGKNLQLSAFDTSQMPLEDRKELQRLRLFLANRTDFD
jgi:hypothetical protein